MPRPRFTPGEITPLTHWIGGWLGLRAGLDIETRGKILCLYRGSNRGRPVSSQKPTDEINMWSYYFKFVRIFNNFDS
jgi:hypothetical protein